MVGLLILGIFKRLKTDFPILHLTIDQVSEAIVEDIVLIIEEVIPYKLEKMLRYTNSLGYTSMDMAGELDQFTILQSKTVHRNVSRSHIKRKFACIHSQQAVVYAQQSQYTKAILFSPFTTS